MFVEAGSPVALPPRKAREALPAALRAGEVAQASIEAYDEGVTAVLRGVGPRGATKRVLVRSLAPTDVGALMIVPIRWEATGAGGQLFPRLDARLALLPVNDVTSFLSIAGRYTVPLGRMGELLDRSALAGVAQRTLELFVRDLVRRMEVRAPQLQL